MSAVWQRPCCFQYRPHGLLKPGPAVVAAICPTKPMPLATLYEHGRHALGNIVQPSFAGLVQLSLHDQPRISYVQGRD